MKIEHFFVGLAVLFIIGAIFGIYITSDEKPFLSGDTFATEVVYLKTSATTSLASNYSALNAGAASTTLAFPCDGASQIDLNLSTVASSTATRWQWSLAFTNDNWATGTWENARYTGSLWFWEDAKTVDDTTGITHGSGPVVHKWTPGTTATSSKNITIIPTATKYCLIEFSTNGANGSLWAAAVMKKAF